MCRSISSIIRSLRLTLDASHAVLKEWQGQGKPWLVAKALVLLYLTSYSILQFCLDSRSLWVTAIVVHSHAKVPNTTFFLYKPELTSFWASTLLATKGFLSILLCLFPFFFFLRGVILVPAKPLTPQSNKITYCTTLSNSFYLFSTLSLVFFPFFLHWCCFVCRTQTTLLESLFFWEEGGRALVDQK